MNAELCLFRCNSEEAKNKYDLALEKGKLHAVNVLIKQIDKVYKRFLGDYNVYYNRKKYVYITKGVRLHKKSQRR